jgi:hypothetical protein
VVKSAIHTTPMNTTRTQRPLVRIAKKFALCFLIACAIAVPVRACVITPYRISGDSVTPELPKGCLAFVYRLTSDFKPGDIVAYHAGENTFVGRLESATATSLKVSRRDEKADVPRERVIGRVVMATR